MKYIYIVVIFGLSPVLNKVSELKKKEDNIIIITVTIKTIIIQVKFQVKKSNWEKNTKKKIYKIPKKKNNLMNAKHTGSGFSLYYAERAKADISL